MHFGMPRAYREQFARTSPLVGFRVARIRNGFDHHEQGYPILCRDIECRLGRFHTMGNESLEQNIIIRKENRDVDKELVIAIYYKL